MRLMIRVFPKNDGLAKSLNARLVRREITVHGPSGAYQRMAWVLPNDAKSSAQFDLFSAGHGNPDPKRSIEEQLSELPPIPKDREILKKIKGKMDEIRRDMKDGIISEKEGTSRLEHLQQDVDAFSGFIEKKPAGGGEDFKAAQEWLFKNKYFGEDRVSHSKIPSLLEKLDKGSVLSDETKKTLIELQAKAMINGQYSSDKDKSDGRAMLEKVGKGVIDRSALVTSIGDALFVLGEYDKSSISKESKEGADIVASAIVKMVGKGLHKSLVVSIRKGLNKAFGRG